MKPIDVTTWMIAMFLMVMLIVVIVGIWKVQRQLGEMNADIIEDCMLVECSVGPFGNVGCYQNKSVYGLFEGSGTLNITVRDINEP